MTREEQLACLEDRPCSVCKFHTDVCNRWACVFEEEPEEQESNTWSLDDAREDFMHDVYNTLDFLPTNKESNRIIDSFDRVTSGIKQEPCEDAISRQAVLDALCKALYEYEDKTEKQFLESEELDVADWFQHRIFVQNMSDIDRQTILNIPSVTPQPKIGQWINFGRTQGEIGGQIVRAFTCSRCSAISIFRVSNGNIVNGDLCPNCGAKMQEKAESKIEQVLDYADQDTLMSAT